MQSRDMLRALRPTVPVLLRSHRPTYLIPCIRSMSVKESDQPAGTSTVQTRMQKTNAKEFYCLTEKDVR